MNQLNLDDPYLRYYANQAGHGVSNVYRGAEYQRGHGIGSFLGGLFRTVTPLLKSGVKVLGKEALRSGVGLMNDLIYAVPPNDAVKNRVKELTGNLKRRADQKIDSVMEGSGYKRSRKHVTIQSIAKLLSKKTPKRKRTNTKVSKSKGKKKPVKRNKRKRTVKRTDKDIFV
jgi:hypothetical protein